MMSLKSRFLNRTSIAASLGSILSSCRISVLILRRYKGLEALIAERYEFKTITRTDSRAKATELTTLAMAAFPATTLLLRDLLTNWRTPS